MPWFGRPQKLGYKIDTILSAFFLRARIGWEQLNLRAAWYLECLLQLLHWQLSCWRFCPISPKSRSFKIERAQSKAKQSKAKCKPLDDWKPNHIIASPCSRFWPFDFVTKLCRFWSPDLAHKRFYTNGYSFNDMMSWCLRPLPGTNWSFRGLFFQLHQLNDAVDPLHNFHEWIAPPVRAKTHSEFEVAPAGITTGCRALFWFLTFYKPAETQLVMKHQSAVLFGHDGIFNQAGAYLPMPIKHWPVDGHIWP